MSRLGSSSPSDSPSPEMGGRSTAGLGRSHLLPNPKNCKFTESVLGDFRAARHDCEQDSCQAAHTFTKIQTSITNIRRYKSREARLSRIAATLLSAYLYGVLD